MALRQRRAVRALLLTRDRELLLLETRRSQDGRFWLTPGGGIEPGESPQEALVRELHEEVGFVLEQPGVEVWRRSFTYLSRFGPTEQHERYFLVETDRFDPHFDHLPEAHERAAILGHGWWRADDILRASDQRFAPRDLARWLEALMEGVPAEPLDVSDR